MVRYPFFSAVLLLVFFGKRAIQVIRTGQDPLPEEKVLRKTSYQYGFKAKLKYYLAFALTAYLFGFSIYGALSAQQILVGYEERVDYSQCDLSAATFRLNNSSLLIESQHVIPALSENYAEAPILLQEIKLQLPEVAWYKFMWLYWFAIILVVFSLLYGIYQRIKTRSKKDFVITLLMTPVLPLLLIYIGYSTHLNNFYNIRIYQHNQVELDFVYPKGKVVKDKIIATKVKPEPNSCILVLESTNTNYASVMASNREVCRQVEAVLRQ